MTTATTRGERGTEPRAALTTPEPDHAPLRKRRRGRVLLQIGCIAVTLFMGVPIYLIALAAFSTRESLNQFPLDLLPVNFSTETIGILSCVPFSISEYVIPVDSGCTSDAPVGPFFFDRS